MQAMESRGMGHKAAQLIDQQEREMEEFRKRQEERVRRRAKKKLAEELKYKNQAEEQARLKKENQLLKRKLIMKSARLQADRNIQKEVEELERLQELERRLRNVIIEKQSFSESSIERETERLFNKKFPNKPLIPDSVLLHDDSNATDLTKISLKMSPKKSCLRQPPYRNVECQTDLQVPHNIGTVFNETDEQYIEDLALRVRQRLHSFVPDQPVAQPPPHNEPQAEVTVPKMIGTRHVGVNTTLSQPQNDSKVDQYEQTSSSPTTSYRSLPHKPSKTALKNVIERYKEKASNGSSSCSCETVTEISPATSIQERDTFPKRFFDNEKSLSTITEDGDKLSFSDDSFSQFYNNSCSQNSFVGSTLPSISSTSMFTDHSVSSYDAAITVPRSFWKKVYRAAGLEEFEPFRTDHSTPKGNK